MLAKPIIGLAVASVQCVGDVMQICWALMSTCIYLRTFDIQRPGNVITAHNEHSPEPEIESECGSFSLWRATKAQWIGHMISWQLSVTPLLFGDQGVCAEWTLNVCIFDKCSTSQSMHIVRDSLWFVVVWDCPALPVSCGMFSLALGQPHDYLITGNVTLNDKGVALNQW